MDEQMGYSKKEGIKIIPFNPEWEKMAADEIQFLKSVLGSGILIEHFGSTSIPGCPAKPIVDLQIWADSEHSAQVIKDLLMPIYQGFSSPASQAKGFMCFDKCVIIDNEEHRTHHIHIQSNREKWERSLLFRDYLREHPEDVSRYAEIKDQAARLTPNNMTKYSELKNEFINLIIEKAGKNNDGNQ